MNSGSWWWTGRPGVLWFMGSQRVGHDWDWTELNWIKPYNCIYKWMYSVMMEIVKDFKRIEINFISLSKKIKTHHVSSGRNTCLLMWYMKLGRRPQNRSYINNSLRSFLVNQLFAVGGQSIGASASASALPMNTQDWFPLGLTGLFSLQSKGLSRVFSNTTVGNHQFFGLLPCLWSNSHIHTWLLERP